MGSRPDVCSSRRRSALASLLRPGLAAGLSVCLMAAACGRCGGDRGTAAFADPAAGPVGSIEGRFVGSASCEPCHAQIYSDWQRSRHRATLRLWSSAAGPPLGGFLLPEGFEVHPSGRVRGPGPDGATVEAEAAYVVGGRHREEIWVRLPDGRLQVFPVAHDRDRDRPLEVLAALPGGSRPKPDSTDFWTRLGRNADTICYGCHATGAVVRIGGATPAGNAVPRSVWREAGVGCEACHGPSSLHAEAASRGAAAEARTPSFGRASPVERIGACASCHALRELLSSPFSTSPVHPYGKLLWERADPATATPASAEFRDPLFPDLRPATYKQEAAALAQSRCATVGGLDCSRCHDPHSGEIRPEARGDRACLPCHAEVASEGPAHTLHAEGEPGSFCADCHMPFIVRGPGSHLARDHSLSSPAAASEGEVPAACAVCHAGPERAPRAIEGWRRFGQDSREVARRTRIAQAIAGWRSSGASPAPVLASILCDPQEGWLMRTFAASLLERAERDATSAGEIARCLRETLHDSNPAVRRAAARALGVWGAARDRDALVQLASSADPFLALAAIESLGRLGDVEYGARLTALVRRPDVAAEYRAHSAIGSAYLYARDWPRAERHLARSIELQPLYVRALNDLGIALFSQGREEAARALWRQALEINPRFEEARLNLEAAAARPLHRAAPSAR